MKPRVFVTLIWSLLFISSYSQTSFTCDDAPDGTIFCDDFESTDTLSDRYFEYADYDGNFLALDGVGKDGTRGMRAKFQANGSSGAGFLHKSFGRTPDSYIGTNAPNPTVDYKEIYWRIDFRTQPGWVGGGGDKLLRATCFASSSSWAQAMIGHIWSGSNDNTNMYLVMDPASGINANGELVTTKYNDFANLSWLGMKMGNIDMFSTENSGKWYSVEAHIKLNTVGNSDGIFEFWINDTLQAGTYDLNWLHDWDEYSINAIYIENYWDNGSPVDQERYFDNFVISTERIGSSNFPASTSVSEKNILNSVNVYPNPTSNYFNVQVGREIAMNGYTLEIFNTNGKSVHKTNEIKNLTYSTDLNGYSSGNYFYRVISNSQQIKTGKLIVHENSTN